MARRIIRLGREHEVQPPPRRALHRIATLELIYAPTKRGGKWRLMRGKTVLWSKPATGPNAIAREAIIARARGYLIRNGYQRLIDSTGMKVW